MPDKYAVDITLVGALDLEQTTIPHLPAMIREIGNAR
jgi:hypothetical protein